MKSSTKRVVIVFTLCHFLLIFSYTIFLAYLPLHFQSKGMGEKGIGSLLAVASLMTLPMVVLFGVVSDRFSPKRLCRLGALLYAVYALGVSRAASPGTFFALQLLGGASFAVCVVTINSLYLKHLSLAHRGKKLGVFLAGSYIGFGVGPLLAGWVAGRGDLADVFWVSSAAAVALFFASGLLEDYPIKPFRLGEYVRDLKTPRALLVIFLLFAEGIHVGAEHTSYTLLMKHRLGMSTAGIGQFYFLIALFFGAITYSIGHGVDRGGRWIRWYLPVGMLISGIFQILTGTATTFRGLLLIRYLHILGDGLLMWTLAYLISMIFPDDRLGGNYGFTKVVNTLGISIGAFSLGMIMGPRDYSIAFYLSGAFQIAVAAFCFTRRNYLDVSHHKYSSAEEIAGAPAAGRIGAPDRPIE